MYSDAKLSQVELEILLSLLKTYVIEGGCSFDDNKSEIVRTLINYLERISKSREEK